MSGVATAVAGVGILGSMVGANQQRQALKGAMGAQEEAQRQALSLLSPYYSQGQFYMDQLRQGFNPGGQFNQGFTFGQTDPSYQFRMSEAMKQLQRSASAKGGLLGGGALKGIAGYSQQLASTEYQNEWQRWLQQRQQNYANLFGMAQMGQQAAGAAAGVNMQGAQNLGNLYGQWGDTGAALATGISGAIGQGIGNWQANQRADQWLNYLKSNPGAMGMGMGSGGGWQYGSTPSWLTQDWRKF